MKFYVERHGDGRIAHPGEIVAFNFRLVDSKDSVWKDTFTEDFPRITKIGDSSRISKERGLDQMLRMVSYGDSITVALSVAQYFRDVVKRPIPQGVDTLKNLTYTVRIDSILSLDHYRLWISSYKEGILKKQLETDTRILNKYLQEKGFVTQQSDSGLQFSIHKEGEGEELHSGQKVWVEYSGRLLNGTTFATSSAATAKANGIYDPKMVYRPKEVVIDQSSVIPGWHHALKLLRNGSRATFYMPSTLCYGEEKLDTLINENEILIFDMEIVKVETKKIIQHRND